MNENVGNLTTKILYGQKWRYMISQLLYDILMINTQDFVRQSLHNLGARESLRGL